MEIVIERHRQEKKEMRNKIIALKRSSGKKDKKKLQDEITQMENDMIARQTEEIAKLSINDENVPKPVEEEESASTEPQAQRISKAQKRRDKKEQDAKRREEELLQAEEDNKNSARNLETKAINGILKARNLKLHSIKSDGDCLYNAIKHQLELSGINQSVESLRKTSADYIRRNRDEMICYMTSAKGDDIMSLDEFEEYCNQVEKTKAWGSQIEIQALSNSLKAKIEVLQSSGSPTISGSDFKLPHLIVTYHRHFFGLGEHYNSTRPITANAEEDEEAE
jgi:OTU domain-containing protein 6